MKQNERKANNVPAFKSRQEEAEFWDSHSPLDYPDYWQDTEAQIDKPRRHEIVLSVRLDENTVRKIEDAARGRHVGKSTMARMLIVESLERLRKAK